MTTTNSRLSLFLKAKGLTGTELADRVGTSQPTISAILSGKRNLSRGMIARVAKLYDDLNIDWLLTGEGEMLREGEEKYDVEEIEDAIDVTTVPLIPTPALANSIAEFMGDGIRKRDCRNIISPVPGAEFAITISGDSMEPKFQDGMVVFLKRINDAAFIPWGSTLVLDTENGAFIKNVFPCSDDNSIEARSINPVYPPVRIPKDSIYGMYRVLNSIKFFTTM